VYVLDLTNQPHEFYVIFSGYQPRQGLMMMMTKMVFETLVQYGHPTRLIAREDYIKFSRRESPKTYIINPMKQSS
jgi:hypothetical protein